MWTQKTARLLGTVAYGHRRDLGSVAGCPHPVSARCPGRKSGCEEGKQTMSDSGSLVCSLSLWISRIGLNLLGWMI